MDGTNVLPVSRCARGWPRATPALRMPCFGRFVNLYALVEQRGVQTRMALVWRDESNRAVTMLVVVPLNEGADPLPGGQQTFKGTARIGRAVFHRSKQ